MPPDYNLFNAWNIGPASGIQAVAMSFTPSASAILREIYVPVQAIGGSGNMVVFILANGKDNAPGSVIESFTPLPNE